MAVPGLFSVPMLVNHAAPRRTISGTYASEGNQLTLNETGKLEADMMTYTLVGDTMTLSGSDEQYDFDDDGQDEPATFTTVLARQ